MISVSEAKKLVQENTSVLSKQILPLYKATNRVLAESVFAAVSVPPYDQSAMDGYAFRFEDWKGTKPLQLIGESIAGGSVDLNLLPNSAFRIYTGAMVPKGCDTVVIQEKVRIENTTIHIEDQHLKKGANIRPRGSQTQIGSLALEAGSVIKPGTSGYLAGLGLESVSIYSMPGVSIISTGKELLKPGTKLQEGKIYESNSYALNAALSELNIEPIRMLCLDDDEALITEQAALCLSDSDVLILSGGVSVGDYDYVAKALKNCGVNCVFHKVKQKPGKPLYFGIKGKQLVFGLPGNPAAVLTCYYEYILPALKKMMGYKEESQNTLFLPLAQAYSKKAGLTWFLKGKLQDQKVSILEGQDSYLMNSFAHADCLVQLNEEYTNLTKDQLVEVHLLRL